jgi:hypothetical protein
MRALLLGSLAALGLLGAAASGRTEGPFTAQIVDADTVRPLAGVVVVALYQRRTPGAVHPQVEFHDLDETVSDADGRITIPARQLPPSTPLAHVSGPEMIIFKSGYKSWHFRGVELGQHVDPAERSRQHREGWRRFRTSGVVIEMQPARTRDDRSMARSLVNYFPPIPEGRARRLREALDDDLATFRQLR